MKANDTQKDRGEGKGLWSRWGTESPRLKISSAILLVMIETVECTPDRL